MRVVYKACVENKGPGITKRSLVRIHDVLLDTGARSPFATLVRVTAKWLTTIDEIHIKNKLQESVARILDQVHETMDGLLSEKVEDEVYQIYRFITKYRVDSSHNCEKICSKSPQNLPVMQTHRKR